jgi:hypothetical protein
MILVLGGDVELYKRTKGETQLFNVFKRQFPTTP